SGLVHVKTPHLDSMEEGVLCHSDVGTKTHNLPATSSTNKFIFYIQLVCVGSSPHRMRAFAQLVHQERGLAGDGEDLADICVGTDRYATYQAGALHRPARDGHLFHFYQLIKLLHHAKCRDVAVIGIGTSGGLYELSVVWIEAGSVAITDTTVDDSFEPQLEQVVLDDVVVRSTELDKDLTEELRACSTEIPGFPTLVSRTTCTRGFYKGK
ncbi:UPP2 phosphorylase, partial [Grus americana]|nr:UPP2 phosphorylase [Grus americana]